LASVEDYSALIVALVSLVTLLWKHLGPDSRTRNQAVNLEGRLVKLETKIDLFWTAVEQNIPRLLKQPIHKRKDDLLDKLTSGKLSKDEAEELIGELDKDKSTVDPGMVLAVTLVLARLQQIVTDNG